MPRFSSRRVQNLKEIVATPHQNFPLKMGLTSEQLKKSPPLDNFDVISNGTDDLDSDPELDALRQAALNSRKRSTAEPVTDLETTSRREPSSRHPPKYAPHSQTNPRPDVRKELDIKRSQASAQATKAPKAPQQGQSYARPASKYDDLNLEDLRQAYRLSKRSRFDRRDDSDMSSSEDDDFEYSHPRRNNDTDSVSHRTKVQRNGNESSSPGFQRQTSNNSIQTRITKQQKTHQNPNNNNNNSNSKSNNHNNTTVTRNPEPDKVADVVDEAAMERRRQKFQLGTEVNPDEKTKVSLASLKTKYDLDSALSTSQETESMHKTATD